MTAKPANVNASTSEDNDLNTRRNLRFKGGEMAESLRRIVVDGVAYRWRFDDVLVVIPGDRSGPQLYVDWGWCDWLEPGEAGNEPRIVTPRFVATAIQFANQHGWPSAAITLRLGFQHGHFELA